MPQPFFVGGLKRLIKNDGFDVGTIQEHYPKG